MLAPLLRAYSWKINQQKTQNKCHEKWPFRLPVSSQITYIFLMWIASNIGFFSIVKKTSHLNEDGPEVHVVRARDKGDLTRLLAKSSEAPGFAWRNDSVTQIHSWDYSDYRYRIYVEETEDFAAIFSTLSATITYDNFKDEILKTPHQLKKYKAYEDLWFKIMDAHRKVHIHAPGRD